LFYCALYHNVVCWRIGFHGRIITFVRLKQSTLILVKVRKMPVFLKNKRRLHLPLSILFIVFSVAFPSGCDKSGEYKPVSFSNRIEVVKPVASESNDKKLRVAVAAMISPKETFKFYSELLTYIGDQVDRDIQLIQRKTYGEINELFPQNKIDMAFVCTGPYATERDVYEFEAVATPLVRGKPYYQSYLIVHRDSDLQSLSDLRQHTFAFTDPDSNTGSLVPTYWLHTINETPAAFFKSTAYTYSHDNSIMAVAKGLVDGAAVDGHKWEYFQSHSAFYTSQTRVIKKSASFGSPPLVMSAHMEEGLKNQIRGVVLYMHNTERGKAILTELMIDRFVAPDDSWYEPVRAMSETLNSEKG
jgi:phosphonate transport system substrate-binding protein